MSEKLNVISDFDDENDSFHSFAQSAPESNNVDNISDIDEDNVDLAELDLETDTISTITSQTRLSSTDLNKTCASSEISESAKYAQSNSISNCLLLKKCHYEVAEAACVSKMPDLELFDMSVNAKAKIPPELSPNTEALQKFAFTEIWVESQQNKPKQKRSLRGDFQAAMDTYFPKEDIDHFNTLTLQEQQKGKHNEQIFVKPDTPINVPAKSLETIPETEPYVSPFEDMPIVRETKKNVAGIKYVTVPAGFDLTNLVEYNNPNHWHRRASTRYDTQA